MTIHTYLYRISLTFRDGGGGPGGQCRKSYKGRLLRPGHDGSTWQGRPEGPLGFGPAHKTPQLRSKAPYSLRHITPSSADSCRSCVPRRSPSMPTSCTGRQRLLPTQRNLPFKGPSGGGVRTGISGPWAPGDLIVMRALRDV